MAVAVAVLEPLALQRRATGGRAQQEPPAAHVAQRPDEIAQSMEPEHRVEDEERDHRLAPRGVGGAAAISDAIEPASVMPSSRIWPSVASW